MRRLGLAFGILVVGALVWAVTAIAATTYSDYVVYGEQGVMIGAGSEVDGLVGARSNNSDYPAQPTPALNMNGGAKILGTARVGEDVTVANTVTITTLYYVGTFTHGSGFVGTATQVPDADLPATTLAAESVWPGGLGTGCPSGPSPFPTSFSSNSQTITLTPGSYGEVKAGGTSHLIFNGAGDYYLQRVQFGNGLTIHVPTPGVRVFVCADVVLAGGSMDPTSLLPGQFTWEVAGTGVAAGTNAFTATGFDWIGNLLVPSRGIHFGTSGGGATWLGYLWGDHVDIEHGVVLTKLPKKSGVKWDDQNGNGVRNLPEDVGKAGFTIQLRDSTNTSVVQSDVTDADGKYEFVDIFPGTYYVCEVQQSGWIQTYPNASTPDPSANDVKTDQCPGPAIYGYLITVVNGDDLNGDDFGNTKLASKSGTKYEDQVPDGTPPFEGTLDNWVIHLFGTDGLGNPVNDSTTTGPNGTYSFPGLYPGTYTVCEELFDVSWTQTYPTSTSTDGTACEDNGYAAGGYTFTLVSGQDEIGNDFANFRQPVFDQPKCQKQTVNDVMDLTYPGNGGPDTTVLTYLNQSIQGAVDSATDSNGDGYIIVMVIAHADGSLGGTANQKVVVDKDYLTLPGLAKPFALFGCSVTLTGGGSDPSVWVKTTANSKQLTINGRKTTIFVMDLHGSDSSVAGVEADGTYRYLRNEYGNSNAPTSAVGIKVVGSYNTVHNGAATGNAGDGVYVSGGYNVLTDTNAMSNGGNGFNVAGSNNQLLKLDAGERGTGNTGDGVHVVGNTNTLSEIDAYANLGDGIDVAGNSNILTKNVAGDRAKGNGFGAVAGNGIMVVGVSNNLTENKASANKGDGFYISGTSTQTSGTANLIKNDLSNTGAAASDLENLGKEWRFFYFIKNNGGGNKADGVTLASGAKGLTNFPASGGTFNYGAAGQAAE